MAGAGEHRLRQLGADVAAAAGDQDVHRRGSPLHRPLAVHVQVLIEPVVQDDVMGRLDPPVALVRDVDVDVAESP